MPPSGRSPRAGRSCSTTPTTSTYRISSSNPPVHPELAIALEALDLGLPRGARGGFTTRAGGASDPPWNGLNLALHVGDDATSVRTNRDALTVWLRSGPVAFPEQVHGAGVAIVDRSRPLPETGVAGVDALVTSERGLPIGVLVADCLPVLLVDPVAGVIGAAHAGRRGLVAGVLQAAIEAMLGLGGRASGISALIGPAICGRCYEVPADMRADVDAAVPGTAATTSWGTPALDLPAGAVGVLESTGVTQVRRSGICTRADERFYSYRRDGVTGRFAGVVMLTGDG